MRHHVLLRSIGGMIICLAFALLGGGAPAAAADPVLVGAGDIAKCGNQGDEITATLLDSIQGTVFTLGDNAYSEGTAQQFRDCYDPTWGRHKARTRPTAGNHDYTFDGAPGYYGYFGSAAGPSDKGWYSYDVGAWHVIVLNSNCAKVGGCTASSPQGTWLKADLAAHPVACTVAMWHHPLFTSGMHGNDSRLKPLWEALYAAGADIVLNGHEHDYERFDPQDPNGRADPKGMREFIVGTGGATQRGFAAAQPNSVVRHTGTYGVLKLTLHPTSYDWSFVPQAGQSFRDSGSANCVGGGTPPPSGALVNPGFELDANKDDRPDGWSKTSAFTRSTAVAAHGGSYVGRFGSTSDSVTRQTVAAAGGKSYTARCWVDIPSTSDSFTFTLRVRWEKADGSTIRAETVGTLTDDTKGAWTRIGGSLTSPSRAASATILLRAQSLGAKVYVDDCSFG